MYTLLVQSKESCSRKILLNLKINVSFHFCYLLFNAKKRNYFVFNMHQLNKHVVSRGWFTETDFKHFESVALRTITNITKKRSTFYGKLKKKFFQRSITKILFIGTEQLSKIWISSKVFFKDTAGRYGTTNLRNWFLWGHFSRALLIDFKKAT